MGSSKVATDVRRLLGEFQPRWVSLDTFQRMRNDPQVAFGTAILRAPLVNLEYAVEGEDPKIVAFVEHVLKQHYRRLALAGSLAIPFGFQVVAKEWAVEDLVVNRTKEGSRDKETFRFPSARVISRFKAIDPRTLTLLIDPVADDWGGVEQRNPQAPGGVARVGRDGAALWSYRREDVFGSLTGFPAYQQIYEPWYAKKAMELFTNRYFERKADPVPKARAPESIPVQGGGRMSGVEYMQAILLAIKAGGGVVLPNVMDPQTQKYLFDFEYMMDDKRGDMFQQRLDALDVQILRGLWITDRAGTTGEVGARAEAEVHAETMAGMLQSNIKEWLDDVVNPQVVEPLVAANFGPEAVRESGTHVTSGGLSADFKTLLKELLQKLIDAEQMMAEGGRVKLADALDGVRIAEQLGIPLRSADELKEIEEARKKAAAEMQDQASADGDAGASPEDEQAVGRKLMKPGKAAAE